MTITTRGNGYQANLVANGKRIRRKFSDKTQAEAWLLENKAKLLRGGTLALDIKNTAGATWEELRRAAHSKYWHGSKGETTAFINSSKVVSYFGGDQPVENLEPSQIDSFVSALEREGNSNATINRKLAALSKMLKFALERNWINRYPNIHRKKEYEGRIRFLSRQEEENLIECFRINGFQQYADLCVFLVDTGARVSEALGLFWQDVSSQQATFWDTKSNKARTIPLTKRAGAIIAALFAKGDGPFAGVSQSNFNKAWNKMKQSMGLAGDVEFVPHALRHTCASRLVQSGVPLLTVKEFLGHKSIQVTLRYAHLLSQNLMDAAKKLEAN